jgi:hypothetical protein
MCATVCPSQALFFGTHEQIAQLRPRSTAVNEFHFGQQTITTQVMIMTPRDRANGTAYVDVTAAMGERPRSRTIALRLVASEPPSPPADGEPDPFAGVEV